ncbi:GTP-binding protein Era [Coccomyxa subellipsoidea C-169]|uniref:GTP-binding protein Era n=1 Tax=Coccomyxa subellipsoidea (strain C-169) TaxID=574566 RepID=I0Z3W4_COCSC|nr:GTP-binding protein Era [Coccomyxa subellipsoidea C-169]EIE25333.1 GTP-binding protein Era [Coccomyxa subellipsoidea C-169]|eukprot:XP_005649877.1 GTP-binding protein Era [Coccomyxa subellipsoidea C-169]
MDLHAGFVAIIGKPNAGKSTLLNGILGQKLSIVTPKAQTTRHRIIGLHSEESFQIIFLDTPGVLREPSIAEPLNMLDQRMMQNVRQATKDADAVLAIVDGNDRAEEALPLLAPYCRKGSVPLAVVLNKVDLLTALRLRQLVEYFELQPGIDAVIPVSALKGRNLKDVEEWAVSHLPEGPALYPKDAVSDHPERFFVGEIVREKIFQLYREEIPYCSTVQVLDYKERAVGKDLVQVAVYVEHESQKGIMVGRGGSALKAMATAARADIEAFVGRPVYLDITVKVKEKWRKNEEALTNLGY